jgi:hypothetical protein
MNERDAITATTDDDTEREPWERAVVPVEPDEPSEIEEVEGEEDGDAGEDAGEVVEGRELVEVSRRTLFRGLQASREHDELAQA